METTYLNLLAKLKEDVKSDNIPDEEKTEILRVIHRLEILLWKYSA